VEPDKTLVTGGARSGKSRYAEGLLSPHAHVTYLAPGPMPDPLADPEWAERVAAHRANRPDSWTTVETHRLAEALADSEPPILIDCLGTWLTAVVDELGTWELPLSEWQPQFDEQLSGLVVAWSAVPGQVVAVTNEVGWGVVCEHRSGRIFTDLLGRTNQAIAAASDQVVLMVAGRALSL
jgi:adenosylcobinamide kinase/adenosylcobinamide-phosphate guanylyltransferase